MDSLVDQRIRHFDQGSKPNSEAEKGEEEAMFPSRIFCILLLLGLDPSSFHFSNSLVALTTVMRKQLGSVSQSYSLFGKVIAKAPCDCF